MTIQQLAADIASRVPAMAKDSPLNNAQLIQSLIEEHFQCQKMEGRRKGWVIIGRYVDSRGGVHYSSPSADVYLNEKKAKSDADISDNFAVYEVNLPI